MSNKFALTEFTKRVLLEGWPARLPADQNPFSSGEVRFDGLRVDTHNDAVGGGRLTLTYYGQDVMFVDLQHFSVGRSIHLLGVTGSMEFGLREV